jgi:hypothetical protein
MVARLRCNRAGAFCLNVPYGVQKLRNLGEKLRVSSEPDDDACLAVSFLL